MCDLESVIRDVNEDPYRQIEFYEYPELYHFFYSRAIGHEEGEQLLKRFQPRETSRVLEVGCGTGLILARISGDYETVMGVDVNGDMLALARETAPSVILRNVDITSWSAADEGLTFDAVFMSGALFHLTGDDDVEALANNVYESLRNGGMFATAFIPLSNVDSNGLNTEKTVESNRYRVTQKKISGRTSTEGHYVGSYFYDITDTDQNIAASIASLEDERWHPKSLVESAFRDAGFDAVELLETNTPKVIFHARR